MREITKTLSIQLNGKPMDFRLTKLDAFSGVTLLRLMTRLPEGGTASDLLSALSDADLRSLMTTCLQHIEVLLPAGWYPVMTQGEWGYPELQYEPGICLKLTIEEVVWTLEGFFGEGGSASLPVIPGS
jgi:hypothetical protein